MGVLEGVATPSRAHAKDNATTFRTASAAPCVHFGRITIQLRPALTPSTPSAARFALPDCFKRFKCHDLLAAPC